MKISKKIFLAAITAAAVAFVGCGMSEGDLDGKGSKWERTIKKDSTTVGVEEASPAYGRAFSQLGTGEKVQSIKTLVTVYTDGIDGLVVDQGDKYYLQAPEGAKAGDKVDGKEVSAVHGVVGFLFDLHKTKAKADAADGKSYKAGDTLYDFVIVGYRSSDKGFYVEKYKNVAEGSMDAYVTTTSFAASKDDVIYITETENAPYYVYDYKNCVEVGTTEDGENVHKFTVTIEQADENKGTYTIKIGDITVGTYEGTENSEKDGTGYAIGGAGAYVNAPVGTIVKATFESDKKATVGLFAEPVEE